MLFDGSRCRNKTDGRTFCSSCRCRAWIVAHPLEYYFKNLKNRARQRKKKFTLTLEEWRRFDAETGFMQLRATSTDLLSINRIEEGGPYSYENICIKPLRLNWEKWRAWKAGQNAPKDTPDENEPF